MAADAVLVAVAAFGCGVVNTIAGGGSLLLFPALVATGMGSLPANVTNSVATFPGYVGGAVGFRSELTDQRHRLPPLAAAAAVGASLGSALLLATSEAAFDLVAPALVALAAVLIALQPVVKRRIEAHGAGSTAGSVGGVLAATVYGGYFGGGLGVILLAVLGVTVPERLSHLNAIKTALSVVSAAVTVVVFGVFGPVRWQWVLLAAPLTAVGGFVGTHLSRRIDEHLLRRAVVVFGLVVAVALAVT